jgi:hypothetical protein
MGGRSGQGTGGGGGGGGAASATSLSNLNNKVSSLIESSIKDAEKIHKGDIVAWERFVYRDFTKEFLTGSRPTNEIKKEVGGYIETSKIYKKEIVDMPRDVTYHINELGKKKFDSLINKSNTQKVSINKINIVQRFVFEKPLVKALKANNNKVVLLKYKGQYYLNDGNHRVAAAKLKGEKSINAVIENVE